MQDHVSRRKFLKIAGSGVAGATILSSSLYAKLAQAVTPPDAAAVPVDARERGVTQPVETGWRLASPRLSTPWTNDVTPDNAHRDYPRPQMTRRHWANLNGVWQFAPASDGTPPPVGMDLGERVLVPFPIESALSGINRHEERMYYRRRFVVPPNWRVASGQNSGQRLLLHFDSVDYETTVWVNGNQLGVHRGGYDRFSFDATDALNVDGSGAPTGEQELIVGVFDPTENGSQPLGKQRLGPLTEAQGIFYTPTSGIWKTVWMEPVDAAYVKRLQMTPDLDNNVLALTAFTGEGGNSNGTRVRALAYDDNNTVVGRITGSADQALSLPVANPRLWSPDDPYLYGLRVELLDGTGSVVDLVDSYFGMRSIALKTVNGRTIMALNGEFVFETGPLDQGFWPDGIYTAPTDEALKFDLVKTRALGYNMVRKHIKVEPDRWYYYTDKLGLLVWQDMPAMPLNKVPDGPAQQEFKKELTTMIDQLRSYPSIVVWVPFNEGWGEFDTTNVTNSVKQQDPSRLADQMSGSNVSNSSRNDGDMLDYHNYVGPGPAPQPGDGRASVIGEFGGLGLLETGHLWTTQNNHAYETEDSRQQLTDRYVELLQAGERLVTRCGLSALIYTQTTDVETEINGLYTYDRRILKPNAASVRQANEAVIAAAGRVTNPPQPPAGTPGLVGVGFWPFNQTSGDVAPDESGFGHDAQLINGPTWTTGLNGNALQFNGQDQYVDTGASILDTTENYSVAALVQLDNLNGFHTAVSQDGDQTSEFFLQYSDADNRFAFSTVSVRALAQEAPEVGRWYYLVGVRDAFNSVLKLYVDGRIVGTANYCPGDPANGNTVIGRGKFNAGPVDFWAGKIARVHVYDRALSPQEVRQLVQADS